ncbi:MAG: protein tyrosine phosphatase [Chlamydiales bacterium]|jgi:protein tyrosine phosphatase
MPKMETMNDDEIINYFALLAKTTFELEIIYHTSEDLEHRFARVPCPCSTSIPISSDEGIRFLHANRVSMPDGLTYIATQYPLENQHDLFWDLCWEECNLIVDLTAKGEVDPVYYSDFVGGKYETKKYLLECKEIQEIDQEIFFYTFLLSQKESGATKPVQRIHYQAFMDYMGTSLGKLSKLIQLIAQFSSESPSLIHCQAGVGRTGTLITAMTMKHLIERKLVDAENLLEKLCEIIIEGRKQRGPLFVESPAQFKTLIELMREYRK